MTFEAITRDIAVTVHPEYLEERSDPARKLYAFAYTVEIENRGTFSVQLVNRHWIVRSNERQIADVKGPGVVGEQPVLNPGDRFQYSSWSVIQDPAGSMEGLYTFVTEDGVFFDVLIPRFELVYPEGLSLH